MFIQVDYIVKNYIDSNYRLLCCTLNSSSNRKYTRELFLLVVASTWQFIIWSLHIDLFSGHRISHYQEEIGPFTDVHGNLVLKSPSAKTLFLPLTSLVSIMTPLQTWPIQREYDPKGMPFRRLGPSGLRVPLFSLGGCKCDLGVCGVLIKLLGRVDSWWNCQGRSCEGMLYAIVLHEVLWTDRIPMTSSSFDRILSRPHSKQGSTCSTLLKNTLGESPKRNCESLARSWSVD